MEARLSPFGSDVAMKFMKYINSAGGAVSASTLPTATQDLVKIRASQINGCGYCTDMHTKDAEHAGQSSGAAEPDRGVAGCDGLHRRRAGRAGAYRAGHPPCRCQPPASLTSCGRTRPSTTTTSSSPRW